MASRVRSTLLAAGLLFAGTLPDGAFASDPSGRQEHWPDRCSSLFSRVFHDPRVYTRGECHDNVCHFLNMLEHEHIPIEDVNVMVIQNTATRHNRNGERGAWNWHVFLEVKGKILDFDYTKLPAPEQVHDYVARNMMPKFRFFKRWQEKLYLKTTLVTVIPGKLYQREYRNLWRDEFFRGRSRPDYAREITLEEYLAEKPK